MLEVFGGDTQRSYLLLSMTKEWLSARQFGATHFHERRNGNG